MKVNLNLVHYCKKSQQLINQLQLNLSHQKKWLPQCETTFLTLYTLSAVFKTRRILSPPWLN